jgi:hypothetical protein
VRIIDQHRGATFKRGKLSLYKTANRTPRFAFSKAAELTKAEMRLEVPNLMRKIIQYRPRIVCFVGKTIYVDAVDWVIRKKLIDAKVMDSKDLPPRNADYDIQPFKITYETSIDQGHSPSASTWTYRC